MAALCRRVSPAAWVGMLVQPDTMLGWDRELVRRKWAAFGRHRSKGRPRFDPQLQTLILEMAKDNPKLGCVRIGGGLLELGHVVTLRKLRSTSEVRVRNHGVAMSRGLCSTTSSSNPAEG